MKIARVSGVVKGRTVGCEECRVYILTDGRFETFYDARSSVIFERMYFEVYIMYIVRKLVREYFRCAELFQ